MTRDRMLQIKAELLSKNMIVLGVVTDLDADDGFAKLFLSDGSIVQIKEERCEVCGQRCVCAA